MKKSLILLAVAILGVFTSCSKDPVYSLSISKHAVIFSIEGGSETILVEANDTWKVIVPEKDKEWIKVNPEQSEYIAGDLVITTIKNNTGAERVSEIVVVNGDNARSITVTQEFITVKPSAVVGKWEMTECDSKGMVGSVFVFNADMSCTATMPMMGNRPINATYTLTGNIISILYGEKTIDIAIKRLDPKNMSAVVMGQYDSKLINTTQI